MKLINETQFNTMRVIKEDYDPTKPQTLVIEGVYIQADRRNGNDRVYRYEVLKPAVDKFINEKVKTNQALEELEHPQEVSINPDRVCCRTISLEENDDHEWIGRSVVLASDPKFGIKGTPCGDIVKSLLQFDTKLGHSTRGVGEIDEDNNVSEYQLICIDTVLTPSIGVFNDSNGNRFVNGILESKDFMINTHGEICERAYHKIEKRLSSLPVKRSARDIQVANAVHDFFNSIII